MTEPPQKSPAEHAAIERAFDALARHISPDNRTHLATLRAALVAQAERNDEEHRKVAAYDAARAVVKTEGNTRAYYVLRTKAAEARADQLQRLLDQLEATMMTTERPDDEVFRFFQRLHGLPEVGAPKHPAEERAEQLQRERDDLLRQRTELQNSVGGYIVSTDELCQQRADAWNDLARERERADQLQRDLTVCQAMDMTATANQWEVAFKAERERAEQLQRELDDCETIYRATISQPVYLENRELRERAERAEAALRQIAALTPFTTGETGVIKAPASARAALVGELHLDRESEAASRIPRLRNDGSKKTVELRRIISSLTSVGSDVKDAPAFISVRISADGNAYAIMGSVEEALRKGGVPKPERDKYMAESMSGDYDNLLRTAMRWVTVS